MHFINIAKGILPLIFIVGLFKITGVEAVGNQRGSSDSKQAVEYDYSDEADTSNSDDTAPKATIKPYFENSIKTVYVTEDIANVTLECAPKNYNGSMHEILWYNKEEALTNGKTSLKPEQYAVDNKYRLTILNYSKDSKGNYSCAVLPNDIRQYMVIEFGAPPENIKNQNGAANTIFIEIALITISLLAVLTLNYSHKF
ncbi:uncharacterized protein ACRADG_009820 [Cochliomyia hominivorax]